VKNSSLKSEIKKLKKELDKLRKRELKAASDMDLMTAVTAKCISKTS